MPRQVVLSKRNRYTVLASVALLVLLGRAWEAQSPPAQGRPPRYGYRVVNTYPHDSQAYTQGLVYRNGFLFESTGLNGRSTLRKVRLETGEVIQQERIDPQYFAEGLAEWNGRLFQLTWQSSIGFVYDLATFRPQRTFSYAGEGWGLTHDGTRLIMSDGTDTLRFLDPNGFQFHLPRLHERRVDPSGRMSCALAPSLPSAPGSLSMRRRCMMSNRTSQESLLRKQQ